MAATRFGGAMPWLINPAAETCLSCFLSCLSAQEAPVDNPYAVAGKIMCLIVDLPRDKLACVRAAHADWPFRRSNPFGPK
jgi:hypothetical protein